MVTQTGTQPADLAQPTSTPVPRPSRVAAPKTFAPLALFAVIAIPEALIPRFRHLLLQLPYFAVPIAVSCTYQYLRLAHPSIIPSALDRDSPKILRLNRIKRVFGWTALAALLAGAASLLSATCSCEQHPILFLAWLLTTLGSTIGYAGLAAYIRERTRSIPAPRSAPRHTPPAQGLQGLPVRSLGRTEPI